MPKVKLVDSVNNSMRMAGVRNWRVEAKVRDGWRRNSLASLPDSV